MSSQKNMGIDFVEPNIVDVDAYLEFNRNDHPEFEVLEVENEDVPELNPTNHAEVVEVEDEDEDEDEDEEDDKEVDIKLGKGKERSWVWKEFTKFLNDKGKIMASCNKCKKVYAAHTRSHGTKNLRRHFNACPMRKNQDVSQMIIDQDVKIRSKKIDPMVWREKLATAIVKHNCPLSFVEWSGFNEAFKYLNPDHIAISRNTCKADVLKIYKREKMSLKSVLGGVSSRICLTSDLWTSITSESYICLTAHFVDDKWKLRSFILNFRHMPEKHTGAALCVRVLSFLEEWGIDKKIFTITLDNASSNDSMCGSLKRALANKLICKGKFLHVRCSAHILNLIVQDGIRVIDSTLKKIRESVKFVKASEGRLLLFKKSAVEMKVETKMGLRLDVSTRWNSTFAMLESALMYREAFDHFDSVDNGGYDCLPSEQEWTMGENLYILLKPFSDITTLFSGRDYVTANLFLSHVWSIQIILTREEKSPNVIMAHMASEMKKKFEKYWESYCSVLSFAMVLDPRFKLKFIDYCFNVMNENDKAQKTQNLRDELYELYFEYCKSSPNQTSKKRQFNEVGSSMGKRQHASGNALDAFDQFESTFDGTSKSELDLYLDEPRLERSIHPNLDVLEYWKGCLHRYPTLSMMARDILSIPITTVASESAFSMGSRLLTKYRASLTTDNAEALICSQNWLNGYEVEDVNEKELLEVKLHKS